MNTFAAIAEKWIQTHRPQLQAERSDIRLHDDATLRPDPIYNPEEWQEPLVRWLDSDCIADPRFHGGVGALHVAFSEREVEQAEVPCSRAVFEQLLREQGWDIHTGLALVSGLMLRRDLAMSGYFPELLSRQALSLSQVL